MKSTHEMRIARSEIAVWQRIALAYRKPWNRRSQLQREMTRYGLCRAVEVSVPVTRYGYRLYFGDVHESMSRRLRHWLWLRNECGYVWPTRYPYVGAERWKPIHDLRRARQAERFAKAAERELTALRHKTS